MNLITLIKNKISSEEWDYTESYIFDFIAWDMCNSYCIKSFEKIFSYDSSYQSCQGLKKK